MMGDEGHLFFGGGVMWLFWILIIAGIFFVFFNMMKGGNNTPLQDKESPLDILKKRYARGEIDEAEYERRRNELED